MLNWVNVASLWKSVGQGQRLPHARHIQLQLALQWVASRTQLRPSTKLKAPLCKCLCEREHTVQAEEEGKNWDSEKHQKEHQAERMKRIFFIMEWRSPHKGPIPKPALEQILPQVYYNPMRPHAGVWKLRERKEKQRENVVSQPWPPLPPVALQKLEAVGYNLWQQ